MEFNTPPSGGARQTTNHELDSDDISGARPLSGPGTSRQTRRLQLRNAGFRGAAVPTRKVTPKSISSSNWSSTSGRPGSSDAENVSPAGHKQRITSTGRRESNGILQEIGNSTATRPKKPRPRMSSIGVFSNDDPSYNVAHVGFPTSPPPPQTTVRARTVKSKRKVSQKRRSVSAEMSKYIEHLESELAATQSQLSAVASPTVVKKHNSEVRTLNAESRHLQDELAEWEMKYEQRVQEEVDKHCATESALRNRIRDLEQDVEDTKSRVQELELQLESTSENLEAVEAANVNLEKRIEIMSDLLAASPTKIDLHSQTPGRTQKHVRPKSMLPRFPTASSLIGSPERQPRTQPTSPLLSFSNHSPTLPHSPSRGVFPLDVSPLQSDYTSEAESVFSEASFAGDSMTSTENFEGRPSFNPWNLPPPPAYRSKPMRRMRRFGAGSLGPKPLILPSSAQCENFPPASAPPLERSETTPVFSLPQSRFEGVDNPLNGRKRASTIATELSTSNNIASPIAFDEGQDCNEETLMTLSSPVSLSSQEMTQRLSSYGSVRGRNLMDELTEVRSNEWTESTEPACDVQQAQENFLNDSSVTPSRDFGKPDDMICEASEDSWHSKSGVLGTPSPPSTIAVADRYRTRSGSMHIPSASYATSAFDRLRMLFGDLWRSPIALARHLIHSAQSRMRIPRPLMNVQWWLVGVLLGPMARRHMLAHAPCCEAQQEGFLLLDDPPRRAVVDEEMAYGTMYETPPGSSAGKTGRRRKHAVGKTRCMHRRSKHSPWLWLKFSITLAFAIGTAFKDGPGSLLKTTACRCRRRSSTVAGSENARMASL